MAKALVRLASLHILRSDLDAAETLDRRGLAIYEATAPNGRPYVDALSSLGEILRQRGDLDGSDRITRRARALAERLAPGTPMALSTLGRLALVATLRREGVTAERYYRQA